VAGEFLLNVSDSGVAHCFEAKTGTILWEERMREHHASLTSAEGHVFFLNDFGVLRTVLPERTYKLLAESELKERVFASPALSEGQMFVRTDRSLICLGKRGAKTAGR
jgi:outer membrane protein assembly factor BamB